MAEIKVDATGKLCPVPLVLTKKEFDKLNEGETMVTLVDNDTSAKNVETFVVESGGKAEKKKEGDVTTIFITKGAQRTSGVAEEYCTTDLPEQTAQAKGHIVYFARDKIGNGEPEELGGALMLAFLNTLKDVFPLPTHAIFMHNGVKLLKKETKTAEAILALEQKGVKIIACGTCLDYLKVMDEKATGKVSNMYDILSLLTKAGKIVRP